VAGWGDGKEEKVRELTPSEGGLGRGEGYEVMVGREAEGSG